MQKRFSVAKNRMAGMGSHPDRLSENAKFKKSGVVIKGLITREFAKIPILGQPAKLRPFIPPCGEWATTKLSVKVNFVFLIYISHFNYYLGLFYKGDF